MGRMMRSLPAALAALVAILVLSTCSNGVDFRAVVTDEVMKANDLYLEVVEVTPFKNQTGVNTFGSLLIEFDRQIDPDTVSDLTISITPDVGWISSFDPLTLILSITPDYLESATGYTVSVSSAVLGTDGSSLRDPYTWSFTTKAGPGGTIFINGGAINGEYTNTADVTYTISGNILTTAYRLSTSDPPGFPAAPDVTGYIPIANAATLDLPAGDGLKKVYIQFMSDENNMTPPEAIFDTITLDTTAPTATSITIASGADFTKTTSVSLDIVASDSSGLYQMQFSNDLGAWSTYETFNSTKAWSINNTEGLRSVRVRVKDIAGNESNLPFDNITLDITGPSVTTFNINSSAAFTNSTSATLTIAATDALSGVNQVRYQNKGYAYTAWEAYATSKAWTLISGDASKTVYMQISDMVGNVTTVSDAIVLDTAPPTISVFTIGSGNPASTNTAAVTLYITATDAASGVDEMSFWTGGKFDLWTAWEPYAATKAWTMPDNAGTHRRYVRVRDNLGNTSGSVYDEIVLNARIIVTYNQLTITNDGDNDIIGLEGTSGEIFYTFYIDGATKLYRLEGDALTLTSTVTIPPAALPQTSYTIYENPTSGSFTMTGTVYDSDQFSADDLGTMSSITYSAPFADVPSATRAIGSAVAGTIYYSIDFVNP